MKLAVTLATSAFVLSTVLSTALLAQDVAPTTSSDTYESWTVSCATIQERPKVDAAAPKADAAKKDKDAADAKKDAKDADAPKKEASAPAAGATKRICEASQIFTNQRTGNEVARVSFYYDPEKKGLVAALRTLVDVSFDAPVQIMDGDKASGKEILKANFKRCAGSFCYAIFDNAAGQASAISSAAALNLVYPLSTGQELRIAMSGKGLTAALAALKAKQ